MLHQYPSTGMYFCTVPVGNIGRITPTPIMLLKYYVRSMASSDLPSMSQTDSKTNAPL